MRGGVQHVSDAVIQPCTVTRLPSLLNLNYDAVGSPHRSPNGESACVPLARTIVGKPRGLSQARSAMPGPDMDHASSCRTVFLAAAAQGGVASPHVLRAAPNSARRPSDGRPWESGAACTECRRFDCGAALLGALLFVHSLPSVFIFLALPLSFSLVSIERPRRSRRRSVELGSEREP